MSRVAVVIPCHDDGEVVEEAVRSVREDEEVEVVVVDDGSRDPDTLARLDALPARVVRHRDARGPGAARNTGTAETRAPLVFALDADDVLVPGALTRMADAIESDPEHDFAWGDYEVFGDYEGRYRAPAAFLPWSLTYVNAYPVCSMFRRSALEAAGGWDDSGYEDWSLWLALARHGRTGVHAGGVVYRRRVRGAARLAESRGRHRAIYEELRGRHRELFERRGELARAERPPLWKRLVYPVLFGGRGVVPHALEEWMKRTMLKRGLRLSR